MYYESFGDGRSDLLPAQAGAATPAKAATSTSRCSRAVRAGGGSTSTRPAPASPPRPVDHRPGRHARGDRRAGRRGCPATNLRVGRYVGRRAARPRHRQARTVPHPRIVLRAPGIVVDRARRTLPDRRGPATGSSGRQRSARYYDAAEAVARSRHSSGGSSATSATYALSEDPAARFERPTLIVTGRQDTTAGYADAWSILDDYPRATYAVLDQEDHVLPVRDSAAYRALVADWLDGSSSPGRVRGGTRVQVLARLGSSARPSRGSW